MFLYFPGKSDLLFRLYSLDFRIFLLSSITSLGQRFHDILLLTYSRVGVKKGIYAKQFGICNELIDSNSHAYIRCTSYISIKKPL